MKKSTIKKAMAEMGRIGGKLRMEGLSKEQRSELAKKGNAASLAVRQAKALARKKEE